MPAGMVLFRLLRFVLCALILPGLVLAAMLVVMSTMVKAGEPIWGILPEARHVRVRDPASLPPARIPLTDTPRSVGQPADGSAIVMSLDQAIRAALESSRAVRVLAGVTAAASGSTVYDPAIAHTGIDQQQARFDPVVDGRHDFLRSELPQALFDPLAPDGVSIAGTRDDRYDMTAGITQPLRGGGSLAARVNAGRSRQQPGTFPLNPETRHSVDLSLSQPLLQGAGRTVNEAPIVVARIDTERSYFQLKDSLQEMVRGVIQAYWDLVAARVNVWARKQQIEQAEFAYRFESARFRLRMANQAQLAQTKLALEQFRANLIAAEAELLDRESALRNLMGLPPAGSDELIPVTAPRSDAFQFDWDQLLLLAQERRPDVIELKLILEADQQLVAQARNQSLPRADAVAVYRWNGLEGEIPAAGHLATRGGTFTDWTLGVDFSVPLGLRASRAALRQQQLVLARDRVNLDEALHQMVHQLAATIRRLDQLYAQADAFQKTRQAAEENLEQQVATYRQGTTEFINLLQAITDWGDAVNLQAQSLTQYNADLATLERQTGTILETHGVRLFEERLAFLGPLGRLGPLRPYPAAIRAGSPQDRYPSLDRPAEQFFNLQPPEYRRGPRRIPPPADDAVPEGAVPAPLPEPLTPPPEDAGTPL